MIQHKHTLTHLKSKSSHCGFNRSANPLLMTALMIATIAFPVAGQKSTASSSRVQPVSADPLEVYNDSVEALVRKVWPSVVQILVTSYGPREEEGDRGNANVVLGRQRSVASGFVIDGDGYIMTNAHVVNGAQRIEVVIAPNDADGSLRSALSPRTTILPARV